MSPEAIIENIKVVEQEIGNVLKFASAKSGKSADNDKLTYKVSLKKYFQSKVTKVLKIGIN